MQLHDIAQIMHRGLRLRCPRCGEAPLFRGPFTMYDRCARCGLLLEREQGYYVGAIYVNYAATTLIAIAGFFLLDAYTSIGLTAQLLLWGAFTIAFPLFFFRYSRSLWLSLEYLFNPEPLEPRSTR